MVFLCVRDGLKTSIKPSLWGWAVCPCLVLQCRGSCDPCWCPVFVPRAGTGHCHQGKGQSQPRDGTAAGARCEPHFSLWQLTDPSAPFSHRQALKVQKYQWERYCTSLQPLLLKNGIAGQEDSAPKAAKGCPREKAQG